MEISEIKSRLTLKEVLAHYHLKPNKHNHLHCPFHEDKNPSMQVYPETNTCFCFSTNCPTHSLSRESGSKSLDVIDFIMYMEKTTKHQAILKAKALIGGHTESPQELSRSAVLTKLFTYFRNGIFNSKPALDYLESRNLDANKLEIGYNTGQFHHGKRKNENLIQSCVDVGMLKPNGKSKTGEEGYKVFAKHCICFPLRNRVNQITGLYFRSIKDDQNQRHFFLKNRQGLYPKYPDPETRKLILTESIIDAASLLQLGEITEHYTLLALYGTNGFTQEHQEAIKALNHLEEVIFFLNGDEAGKKATEKYSEMVRELKPEVTISTVNAPENEDVNSLLQGHEPEIFGHLLQERSFFFSNENPTENETSRTEGQEQKKPAGKSPLDTSHPYKLQYSTETAHYATMGKLPKSPENLKVTLQVSQNGQKARNKLDLYEDDQLQKTIKKVSERLNLDRASLENDLYRFTDLLEQYREETLFNEDKKQQAPEIPPLTEKEQAELQAFLKQPGLIQNINELLGKAGIVGEDNTRIFLFLIALSHKFSEPLHGLIQGSSGSGKTRLLKQISACMPQENVTKLTRVSERVFYNYPENHFVNRLLCLEDVDGLPEEAEFAFRELQSNGELSSATSIKQENGEIISGEKLVKGPIASLACTTQGEIYEDNLSRVFLIAVDESDEQTQKIIRYQNERAGGSIDAREEAQTKHFLQHLVRHLKPLEVKNPYSTKIYLPEEAHKIRRLNELFQSFTKMITILNQYQRKKDGHGRLITEKEDLQEAIGLMFESIVLKVDELDGSLRQFFEQLKAYVEKQGEGRKYEFIQREVRQALKVSKTQMHRYMQDLMDLEYIQVAGGYANRGYRYKIIWWDSLEKLKERIKSHLYSQLDKLE